MRSKIFSVIISCVLVLALFPVCLSSQVDPDTYERADRIRTKFQSLALNMVDRGGWIPKTSRYWYHKSVEDGFAFHVVDAEALTKRPAFDQLRLAESLSKLLKDTIDPKNLPFRSISYTDNEESIRFEIEEWAYTCDLGSYACKQVGPARRWGRGGFSMWERGPAPEASSSEAKASPDGKWEAFIKNYNTYIRSKETGDEIALSRDGTEGDYYTFASLAWSPDSRKLAGYRLKRGYHRIIHYVESSPSDQLQPKHHQMEYAKPGDALDIDQPVLFLIDSRKHVEIDNALFSNPYDLSNPVWRKDSRAFTFEYNQRGHQVYRIIEVDASGMPRAVISEEADTFFSYSNKKFRQEIDDGLEIV
ncbi:MAG: DPP IV N-terminal domain-containing protein, partial [Candidatus Aminicenantaceae bacterium]